MPEEKTARIDEELKAAQEAAEWVTEEELTEQHKSTMASFCRRKRARIPGL